MKGGRPGDWNCPSCGDLQFARNTSCRKCGEPKPDGSDGLYDDAPMDSFRPMDMDMDREDRRGKGKGKAREMKPGDWICDACGDHQFARNDRCRKCGAPGPNSAPEPRGRSGGGLPRPMPVSVRAPDPVPGGGREANMKPGDWICPACNDLQFARNSECRKCGEPAPGATFDPRDARDTLQSDMRPGDWFCHECGDLQFARNTSCRKCGAPKADMGMPEDMAMPEPRETRYSFEPRDDRGGGKGGKGGGREVRDGDWDCPACGDLQFARNDACRKCGEPRPVPGGFGRSEPPPAMSRSMPVGDVREGDWMCPGCGEHVFARNSNCRRCGHAKPQPSSRQIKDGDWTCPECGDHVFGRNDNCRKCGAPRPGGGGGAAMFSVFDIERPSSVSRPAPVSGGRGGGYDRPPPARQERKEGDWNCPNCGDLQFARNEACRKCGTPCPAGFGMNALKGGGRGDMGGGKGKGKGGGKQDMRPGDWRCPDCGDLQFARNAACRKCGAPKPEGDDGGRRGRSRSPFR